MSKTITSYKGFDENFKCRDFQYEIGKSYEIEGDIKLCENGFHACQAPFDVFSYYPPTSPCFAVVEQSGDMDESDDKIASSKIHIKAEISLFDMIKAQVEWVKSGIKKDKKEYSDEDYSAASNTGDYSAASNTGNQSAASVEGEESIAVACGYQSKAMASEGSWIVLAERNNEMQIIIVKAAKAGADIKPNVYYMLVSGEFVEAEKQNTEAA